MVIFLKGCNQNCVWCHNPESISREAERMYAVAKCIKCETCVLECPEHALSLTTDGIITDTNLCNLCGRCANVCPTKAIEISGKSFSVAEIMDEIEKECIFFDQSGGGVTFSGGEPLLQHEFLIDLLEECGKRGIHRAVDTAGLISTDILRDVAKQTDLFLFDLKLINSENHLKWVGVRNEKIIENLKVLAEIGAKIIIRIPLVGGINDDVESITESARLVSGLAGEKKEVNLLPYHKIAQNKYEKLGRPNDFRTFEEPNKEAQSRVSAIFEKFGIKVSIGG